MQNLKEEKLSDKIKIDLNALKEKKLNEVYLESFGGQIALALEKILSGASGALQVTGAQKEVNSFLNAIASEANYLQNYYRLGLNNPYTWGSAQRLDGAIRQFESQTGLRWPLN
tara:strand:- start:1053 stop:1394 length:342 start_codon:yes stop_codon:yes gene_type:complete